ncbi:hypothetical protein MNKW57_15340 [Biformimicrobium ophioploci]|uniref:Uncharacterized protein n=1 Tax=Biformimicrobium ophioploci TaxID=3036711 RepID=A0ABQ6LYN4_9GAMM|nr:hypothetical protein MNKW57_15340 [Microbulbifer sp. NKW57]
MKGRVSRYKKAPHYSRQRSRTELRRHVTLQQLLAQTRVQLVNYLAPVGIRLQCLLQETALGIAPELGTQ